MTTDIETIEAGLPLLQDTWINFIELGIGIYLLSRTVGKAAFLVLVSTLRKSLLPKSYGHRIVLIFFNICSIDLVVLVPSKTFSAGKRSLDCKH